MRVFFGGKTYSHEDRHGSPSCMGLMVDVRHYTRDYRDRGAGKSADEEPKDEEGWPIWCKSTCKSPDTEHEKRCDDEPLSAKLLTHGSPHDWT